MSQPTLTVTQDSLKDFNRIISKFKNDAVLVGIPEGKNERSNAPIGNAAIMAINEFGSAANNIPARHPMKTGIKNAQDEIAEQFKLAATNALSQGFRAINTYYNRAGIIASNSIKKVINAQEGFPDVTGADPLAPKIAKSTYRARQAKGFKGTKALVVTGQLRNSVTYVVQEKL